MPTTTPAAPPTPAATMVPGDAERTVTVGSTQRTYLLHIPPGLTAGKPLALVFVFHSLVSDGNSVRQNTGFNDVADAKGFLVVYPNGTGTDAYHLSWNAGLCCGVALKQNIDEKAFVRQILADLNSIAEVDPKRVYATGWDNGAFLSYRLGCEMSDTFAAIAPVNGVLIFDPCLPEQPVSVIHLAGLNDLFIPYAGGGNIIDAGDTPYPSVQQVIATWVGIDGCSGDPQINRDGLITRTVYAECKGGTGIELDTMAGIGHCWPSPYAVPASEMIWDFFAAHPKP
jgi:polyhydroxybutyrate depolymerase